MPFPPVTPANNGDASNALRAAAASAGLVVTGLSEIAILQSAVANLLQADPSSVQIPAGDVLSGTFGANKSGGADSGAYTFPGAATVTGALSILAGALATSPTLGIGYAAGAGGATTQPTTRSTAVTLNTVVGTITTSNSSLAALGSVSFTVVNTVVAATDLILLTKQSGDTANTSIAVIDSVGTGSFVIRLYNTNAVTADTAAGVLNFAVIKGAAS